MDIAEIKTRMEEMADKVGEMIDLTERGFLENKAEFLADAMTKEKSVNETEKLLTNGILELSKRSKKRKELAALEQCVETLERMGDEVANLIERIEVKVAEKLLFSEDAVEQFNETFDTMKKSVAMMRRFLKEKNSAVKSGVIDNGLRVKGLVERYRKEHADRLIRGECTPMGANMYFDMLDFTGNLARHASTIVKLF